MMVNMMTAIYNIQKYEVGAISIRPDKYIAQYNKPSKAYRMMNRA